MGQQPRRALGDSTLMPLVREIANHDGRSTRDAVRATGLAHNTWSKWLKDQQPMVFQQLEQVLDNYGYALIPVPKGTAQAAALEALAQSLVRGLSASATPPLDQHAEQQEGRDHGHHGEKA